MKGIWLFTLLASHSNASAAGANKSIVLKRHVPAIVAEHGNYLHFIVSYMKWIGLFTYIPAWSIGEPQ
jgi:hypothetical protein